jgi:hypothetical protein
MGADLYVEEIIDKTREEYSDKLESTVSEMRELEKKGEEDSERYKELKVKSNEYMNKMYPEDGYFRDSYNNSSLFWNMGLSWWKDVGGLLDEDGNLTGDNLRKLIKIVKNSKVTLPEDKEKMPIDISANEYLKILEDRKNQLLDFLNNAMLKNYPILCSI